jgi:hypothetical protein
VASFRQAWAAGDIFEGVSRRTGCATGRKDTVEDIVELAVEIAREGREGRKIGTLFVIGSVEELLQHSRPLILDPLYGHPPEVLQVTRADFRETVKELAQLDGAFLVADDGTFVSAGRFVEVDLGAPENFLPGLGTRHAAGRLHQPLHRRGGGRGLPELGRARVRPGQAPSRDHPGAVPDVEAVARRPGSPHRAPPEAGPDAGRGGDAASSAARRPDARPTVPVMPSTATAADHAALRDEALPLVRDLLRLDTTNGAETPAAVLLKEYLEAAGVACELVPATRTGPISWPGSPAAARARRSPCSATPTSCLRAGRPTGRTRRSRRTSTRRGGCGAAVPPT